MAEADIAQHRIQVPRTARYYTLGQPGPETREVWVVCHGYGQLARYFARPFRGLESARRLIVVPEALSRFYLNSPGRYDRVGATWMTRDDRLDEIRDQVTFLDSVLKEATRAIQEFGPVRLGVLGFSQGAATATRWIDQSPLLAQLGRPDRFIVWGADLPDDLDLARTSWLGSADLHLVIGDEDEYATPARIGPARARLERADVPYQFVPFPGGHRIVPDVLRDVLTLP